MSTSTSGIQRGNACTTSRYPLVYLYIDLVTICFGYVFTDVFSSSIITQRGAQKWETQKQDRACEPSNLPLWTWAYATGANASHKPMAPVYEIGLRQFSGCWGQPIATHGRKALKMAARGKRVRQRQIERWKGSSGNCGIFRSMHVPVVSATACLLR